VKRSTTLFSLAVVMACASRAPRSAETVPPAVRSAEPAPPEAQPSVETRATLVLPIPARTQAPDSPPAGWCGETAIQEALLHLGMWAPQRVINRAGKPSHPDLYSNDVPVALTSLGVDYSFYPAPRRGFATFERWVRAALDAGDPVLAGVKILPTEHPTWGLDHFVLVVGYGAQGLLVNTTWGTRQWVGDTSTPGLSFKNASYAIRLRRIRNPARAVPARLTVLSEDDSTVTLRAECPTEAYHLEQPFRSPAAVTTLTIDLKADPDTPSRFDCAPR
jgi:hypothetical protein